jgi:hypothetical protein
VRYVTVGAVEGEGGGIVRPHAYDPIRNLHIRLST